jgi:hypothetical protein
MPRFFKKIGLLFVSDVIEYEYTNEKNALITEREVQNQFQTIQIFLQDLQIIMREKFLFGI